MAKRCRLFTRLGTQHSSDVLFTEVELPLSNVSFIETFSKTNFALGTQSSDLCLPAFPSISAGSTFNLSQKAIEPRYCTLLCGFQF